MTLEHSKIGPSSFWTSSQRKKMYVLNLGPTSRIVFAMITVLGLLAVVNLLLGSRSVGSYLGGILGAVGVLLGLLMGFLSTASITVDRGTRRCVVCRTPLLFFAADMPWMMCT